MKAASKDKLLLTEVLLDLGERPVEEPHPNLATLTECIAAAREAKADEKLVDKAQTALDTATANRIKARTALAKSRLLEAATPSPDKCDVKVIGEAIKVAKEESVEEVVVEEAVAHEYNSYKVQAENGAPSPPRPPDVPNGWSRAGRRPRAPPPAALACAAPPPPVNGRPVNGGDL